MKEFYVGLIAVGIGLYIIFKIISFIKRTKAEIQKAIASEQNIQTSNLNGSVYVKRELLTANEQVFYNKIKNEIYSKGLHIITKIRLADLIEPKKGLSKKEYNSLFGKIKSKHIDFAIVTEEMKILYLIELDDKSHNTTQRIERDNFVNTTLKDAGYKILRVYNNLEGALTVLNIVNENHK